MHEGRSLPEWVFTDGRPTSDQQYFENMTRCVFQGGLSWEMLAKKWPNFRAAFDNFEIDKVAAYGMEDQERLLHDAGIVRNRQKIMSTIHNAEEFKRIASEECSFQKWLDGLDKSNNFNYVVKRLSSRFKRLGPASASIFLWSVGEGIEWDSSLFDKKPKRLV